MKLDVTKMDVKTFLKESLENGHDLMENNVFSLNSPKKFEIDAAKKESVDEIFQQLMENNKYVYVNFSSNAMDAKLECIDGNTYLYLDEDGAEEYFEIEEMPEDFKPYENLKIYEDNSVGYLLQTNEGEITINSAIIDVTNSSIELIDDAEIFEIPMQNYINKYIS